MWLLMKSLFWSFHTLLSQSQNKLTTSKMYWILVPRFSNVLAVQWDKPWESQQKDVTKPSINQ